MTSPKQHKPGEPDDTPKGDKAGESVNLRGDAGGKVADKPTAREWVQVQMKTYLQPERGIVYDMAKCSHEFFMVERDWHFIEHSAYQALERENRELRLEIDTRAKPTVEKLRRERDELRAEAERLRCMRPMDYIAENARLRSALEGLLADTEHLNHHCKDGECPVAIARAALEGKE